MNILTKIFGTQKDRDAKRMKPFVEAVGAFEPQMQAMTDEQLAAQTQKFRDRLKAGATLKDIEAEAFATVREASRRFVNMRDFDVQLMGGLTLADGKIAEMKTGEGKTLVAPLAAYLNALSGEGVHVITVNDYLAQRDSDWMGKVYRGLGLTVGAITHEMNDPERKAAYNCDVTYGTATEFGFDYLRDNMKFDPQDCVQRGHNFALVDEVDSILIDEARTPLIISGPADGDTSIYNRIDGIVKYLEKGQEINPDDPDTRTTTGDYIVDEKQKTVSLTEQGITKVEQLLNLDTTYDVGHMEINHMVETAIKAHELYLPDVNYIKKDGEIIIVDEFTGRLMPGRRWSDGLHQAIEAKEGVKIQGENQTLASITLQNYFRMYKKLSGMTGTAETEAAEFYKIYKLEVVEIPTNKDSQRDDQNDIVYHTEEGKFQAVGREIKATQATGEPVLVGTVDIEKSEKLDKILTQMGVPHEVLNAKNNAREAEIVAQAGRKGAVTVSTNMAGRGTDILLGGNPDFMAKKELVEGGVAQALKAEDKAIDGPQADGKTTVFSHGGSQYSIETAKLKETVARYKVETDKEHDEVVKLGGLYIIGTERHESRRIDNQLRGRAGRQGDPGKSRFFLSLQDRLVRLFGGPRLTKIMELFGMSDDTPIESKMVSRSVENAQKKVEQQNFDARKNLIDYDDVMNKQREIIYAMRKSLMEGKDLKDRVLDMADTSLADMIDLHYPKHAHPDMCDWQGLAEDVKAQFGVDIDLPGLKNLDRLKLEQALLDQVQKVYEEKEATLGKEGMAQIGKTIMLSIVDEAWKSHMLDMDDLKTGINLRSYAQIDPLVAFKKDGFEMFKKMLTSVENEMLGAVYGLRFVTTQEAPQPITFPAVTPPLAPEFANAAAAEAAKTATEATSAQSETKPAPVIVVAPPPPAPPGH